MRWLSFFGLLCFATAVKLPPAVKLCSKKNPNFLMCVQENMGDAISNVFKNGNRELGIPKLEPFEVTKLEIQGAQTGSVKMDQKYENIKMVGFSTGKINNFKIDSNKKQWTFYSMTENLVMESDYELKGQLLVFPINGKGKSRTSFKNLRVDYTLKYEGYKVKNKNYYKVTEVLLDMKPEVVNFDFENIIPGNPQVSAEVVKTMNENSKSIFKDVKGAFEQVFSQLFKESFNNVFSKIPVDDIFLP